MLPHIPSLCLQVADITKSISKDYGVLIEDGAQGLGLGGCAGLGGRMGQGEGMVVEAQPAASSSWQLGLMPHARACCPALPRPRRQRRRRTARPLHYRTRWHAAPGGWEGGGGSSVCPKSRKKNLRQWFTLVSKSRTFASCAHPPLLPPARPLPACARHTDHRQ